MSVSPFYSNNGHNSHNHTRVPSKEMVLRWDEYLVLWAVGFIFVGILWVGFTGIYDFVKRASAEVVVEEVAE